MENKTLQDNERPEKDYLSATPYVDSDSPEVREFVYRALDGMADDASDTEKTIRLFDVVRDTIRYDPYMCTTDLSIYRASAVSQSDSAFCVPKAILLAACLRAAGIPAALGFADVRNHLNTEKLKKLMGSDVFIYHGYVQVWLEGKSYKITPAFNMELCDRFGVKPLIFDGKADALFHEYNQRDQRHMEYIRDRGLFQEAPVEQFIDELMETYPNYKKFTADHDSSSGAVGYDEGFAPSSEDQKA